VNRNTKFTCSHTGSWVGSITNYETDEDFSLELRDEAEVAAVEQGKEYARKVIDDVEHVFGETL
jgi:hypothetical protein